MGVPYEHGIMSAPGTENRQFRDVLGGRGGIAFLRFGPPGGCGEKVNFLKKDFRVEREYEGGEEVFGVRGLCVKANEKKQELTLFSDDFKHMIVPEKSCVELTSR